MIPKIIHYCWFGRKDKPESFCRYLKTWEEYLPDFEIIEWNEDNFDVNYWLYSREAYATGNFAHVSDVCRIYVLNVYGGIYLDTDVEVCRSFDGFLSDKTFVGMESTECIGTCVIGSEANVQWLNMLIEYYENTHFINLFGHCVRTPNTVIISKKILPHLSKSELPTIYPIGYFCDWEKHESRNSIVFAVHHYHASWRKKRSLWQKMKSLWVGFKIRHFWNLWTR